MPCYKTPNVDHKVPLVVRLTETSPLPRGHSRSFPRSFQLAKSSVTRWWFDWLRKRAPKNGLANLRDSWWFGNPANSPVEGEIVEIPFFTGFQKHPRWLAGFLPSTGPRKPFKVWKFNKHRLYKWLGGKRRLWCPPGGVLWSETIRNKVGRFCAARCFPFIVHLKSTSHNFTCLIMFDHVWSKNN